MFGNAVATGIVIKKQIVIGAARVPDNGSYFAIHTPADGVNFFGIVFYQVAYLIKAVVIAAVYCGARCKGTLIFNVAKISGCAAYKIIYMVQAVPFQLTIYKLIVIYQGVHQATNRIALNLCFDIAIGIVSKGVAVKAAYAGAVVVVLSLRCRDYLSSV